MALGSYGLIFISGIESALAAADPGLRCVAPNQRGYSAGARPDPADLDSYRFDKLTGDALDIVSAVGHGNKRFHLVGHGDHRPGVAGFERVEVQSGWSYEGLASYKEFRDEKVAFFAERLPRGTHNLSYRVKAEIPGRFSALPTKIEAMYAPDLKGNSDEWKARIVE